MNVLIKQIGFLAILFSLTLSGYSQEGTEKIILEIQSIQDNYEESIKIASSPLVTLGNKYLEALTVQQEKAQKVGNFKEIVALKEAVEEFNKGESLDGLSDSPTVAKLEGIASKQFKLQIRSAEKPTLKAAQIRVSQLKQALKDLTKSGNFESAEKVDQLIKILPTRYDSSWAQSEIKRVASIDGVKIPMTVVKRSSLLSDKEKQWLPYIPTPNKKPQIFSVSIDKDELKNGGEVTIKIQVSSLTEIVSRNIIIIDPNGKEFMSSRSLASRRSGTSATFYEKPRKVWTSWERINILADMPSGEYKIAGISVVTAAGVKSDTWKELTFMVNNAPFALDK